MSEPVLLILPALPGHEVRPGVVRLTKKFVEGLEQYVGAWPGRVHVVLHPGRDEANLDEGGMWPVAFALKAVSYTHLTLPTSDLV